jgi:hypothetical protein
MPVDMDVAIQRDGSLLATRIAVYDADTTNLTASSGPLVFIDAAQPSLLGFGVEDQGPLFRGSYGPLPFDFESASFQISGQLTNLQSLPFRASFDASSIFAGQNVFISTHATSWSGGNLPPATTLTLLPQTLNGTVTAISSAGGFTTYTVGLAPYDLIPNLAAQSGQTTVLSNVQIVVIYADDNTQLLNTKPIAIGTVVRFNGLLFNDNGTLRMDCAQVSDGVAE